MDGPVLVLWLGSGTSRCAAGGNKKNPFFFFFVLFKPGWCPSIVPSVGRTFSLSWRRFGDSDGCVVLAGLAVAEMYLFAFLAVPDTRNLLGSGSRVRGVALEKGGRVRSRVWREDRYSSLGRYLRGGQRQAMRGVPGYAFYVWCRYSVEHEKGGVGV